MLVHLENMTTINYCLTLAFHDMNLYIQLKGGLGNQMFQYAKGLSALEQAPQYTNLILDCSFYDGQERKIIKNGLTGRNFDLDIFDLKHNRCEDVPPGGHMLEGWFQNIEEFDNVINEVKENFKFLNKFPDNIQNLYEEIKSKGNSVSVHIRRGDFVSNPTAAEFNFQLDFPYYKGAMNIIENNNESIHYYIFSEDIDWCKENLHNITSYPITFVDDSYCGDRDSGHFYLMQSCNNHIIANSTYSWWAAFLSNSKTTIGPKKWTKEMNGSDIMLDDWIII